MLRHKYYKHAKKARSNPKKYLSIIIDAMDQAKTHLPHFMYVSKYMANMWKLRLNLVGVIIHGVGTYGFFDYFQWSHGSDVTISILVQCLLMLDNLPKTLYLQSQTQNTYSSCTVTNSKHSKYTYSSCTVTNSEHSKYTYSSGTVTKSKHSKYTYSSCTVTN